MQANFYIIYSSIWVLHSRPSGSSCYTNLESYATETEHSHIVLLVNVPFTPARIIYIATLP